MAFACLHPSLEEALCLSTCSLGWDCQSQSEPPHAVLASEWGLKQREDTICSSDSGSSETSIVKGLLDCNPLERGARGYLTCRGVHLLHGNQTVFTHVILGFAGTEPLLPSVLKFTKNGPA